MKLRCPACATSYDLRPGQLAPGRQVRCARCGDTWTPESSGATEEAEIEEVSGRAVTVVPPTFPRAEPPILDQAIGFPEPPREPAGRRRRRPARIAVPGSAPAGLPAFAAVGGAVLLIVGAVVLRTPIVAAAPDLAGLYRAAGLSVNLRGLEFRNLSVSREDDGGRAVLLVSGAIENVSGREVEVPAIRLAIRAGARHEIYAWSVEPDASRLPAGASLPFRTRIDTPPADARDVVARFTDRRRVAAAEAR